MVFVLAVCFRLGFVMCVLVRVGMRIVGVAVRVMIENGMRVIRHVFARDHPDSGGADAAPVRRTDFNPCIEAECSDGSAKQLRVNSCAEQSAQHHVTTDARETVEIGNSHKSLGRFSFASWPDHAPAAMYS